MADMPQQRESILNRLRHRKVVQWSLVYVAGAWGSPAGFAVRQRRVPVARRRASNRAAGRPTLASLHSDPRWLPLLRRLSMAPEQLAAIKFDVTA